MRMIDKSRLLSKFNIDGITNVNINGGYFIPVLEAQRVIEEFIEVDAVPVVRCRDCTEYDKTENECKHWYGFKEKDFCSYGQRKEDKP